MKRRNIFATQEFIVLIIFIALFIVFSIMNPQFSKYTTIITMFDYANYYVLMAFGVGLCLMTGGTDLSLGTGLICYAAVGGSLVLNAGMPVIVGLIAAILCGTLFGLLNGVLIAHMDLPPFLATLCTCMIARGVGSLAALNNGVPWPSVGQPGGWFHNIFKVTMANGLKIPVGFIWILVLMFFMRFVLNSTNFGRYLIAIGSNKEATRLSGINVKMYHMMVYVICGLFTGVAAVAYAAATPSIQPGQGAGIEMDAIGGAIVGGVSASGGYGTIPGIFIGMYVILALKVGLPFIGMNANWQQIITGIVLIAATLIDIIRRRNAARAKGAVMA